MLSGFVEQRSGLSLKMILGFLKIVRLVFAILLPPFLALLLLLHQNRVARLGQTYTRVGVSSYHATLVHQILLFTLFIFFYLLHSVFLLVLYDLRSSTKLQLILATVVIVYRHHYSNLYTNIQIYSSIYNYLSQLLYYRNY